MKRHFTRTAWLGLIAAAGFFGGTAMLDSVQAAEKSPLVVGTYEPQQAAEESGINEKLMQSMQGLQERMQAAQQQGDQQAMQQIQMEAQQIQADVVRDYELRIDAAMPAVAESTGVDIIAAQVAYVADGIETKDVTSELVKELNGGSSEDTEQPELLFQQ